MKTLASACRNRVAAAVVLDLGIRPALEKFRTWAERDHWTSHDWIQEEVLTRVSETDESLRAAEDFLVMADADFDDIEQEEPFISSFRVRVSRAEVHAEPAFGATVVAEVKSGQVLRT